MNREDWLAEVSRLHNALYNSLDTLERLALSRMTERKALMKVAQLRAYTRILKQCIERKQNRFPVLRAGKFEIAYIAHQLVDAMTLTTKPVVVIEE